MMTIVMIYAYFNDKASSIGGVIMMNFEFGSLKMKIDHVMIQTKSNYNVLMLQDSIHEDKVIPSCVHQK